MLLGVVLLIEISFLPIAVLLLLKRKAFNASMYLIIAVCTQLLFFTANDSYLHDWDEKYHALVAKHLAEDPLKPCLYEDPIEDYDYKQWTINHIWLHKPPMALWIMAGIIKVFGTNELAIRLPSVLLSLLSVFLTFLIGKELFSKQTGVVAAFFLAFNGFFVDITAGRTTTDHIDSTFLFFVLLGIYLSIKYYSSKKTWLFVSAAIVCGLALLTKWLPALIIVGLFGLMGLMNKIGFIKNVVAVSLFTAISFLVYLPWRLYTQQQYPLEFAWEQAYNLRHLTEVLEGHQHPWWYYLDWIRIIWNEAIYMVLIFLFWRVLKFKHKSELILLAWLFVPLLVFSFSATKMPGYVLISAPAAFISIAIFCVYLLTEFKYRKLGIAMVFALFLLAQRYCIERVKPFDRDDEKEKITLEIKRLKNSIDSTPTVLYGNPFPIETMFYTEYISYASLPTEEGRKNAHRKGYQIAVLDNGQLPKELLLDSQILKIKSPLATFNPN